MILKSNLSLKITFLKKTGLSHVKPTLATRLTKKQPRIGPLLLWGYNIPLTIILATVL